MAKKSARSKGYRTYKKEEKGFTKGEIRTMIIGFAVIVIALICVLVLPDAIESRHLLKVKDGAIVDAGDNWLIRNVGDSSKAKYRKIAEVNPADGYQLHETTAGVTDDLETMFYFEPTEDNADAAAQEYYVVAGSGEYDALVSNVYGYVAMLGEILEQSEIQTVDVGGRSASYFTVKFSVTDSSDEENPTTTYNQMGYMYVDADVKDNCVVICASNTGDSEDVFTDDAALVEVMTNAASQIVMAK